MCAAVRSPSYNTVKDTRARSGVVKSSSAARWGLCVLFMMLVSVVSGAGDSRALEHDAAAEAAWKFEAAPEWPFRGIVSYRHDAYESDVSGEPVLEYWSTHTGLVVRVRVGPGLDRWDVNCLRQVVADEIGVRVETRSPYGHDVAYGCRGAMRHTRYFPHLVPSGTMKRAWE